MCLMLKRNETKTAYLCYVKKKYIGRTANVTNGSITVLKSEIQMWLHGNEFSGLKDEIRRSIHFYFICGLI